MLIPRLCDTLTAGYMARSTKKQVTGKHGTPEEKLMASGSSQQDSKNSEWLSSMQRSKAVRCDKPPSEWKTRIQLEAEFGLRQSRMRDVIRSMLLDNVIERRTFIVMTDNVLRHIPHYRLK